MTQTAPRAVFIARLSDQRRERFLRLWSTRCTRPPREYRARNSAYRTPICISLRLGSSISKGCLQGLWVLLWALCAGRPIQHAEDIRLRPLVARPRAFWRSHGNSSGALSRFRSVKASQGAVITDAPIQGCTLYRRSHYRVLSGA
jgi:hypothetical protein